MESEQFDIIAESLVFLAVQSTRIYDVLICLLNETNPEKAYQIESMHKEGGTISSPPYFNQGVFNESD